MSSNNLIEQNSSSSSLLVYFSNNTGYQNYNVHYYYFFVHPLVYLTGAIMNTLCTIVFAQKPLLSSGPFYHYYLVNSAFSAFGCVLFALVFITRCGPICGQDATYWSQIYELYACLFVVYSIYIASSLLQIAISFQLYFSITQKLVDLIF